MLLWILAIVLLVGLAVAGYYAGAIRAAFSLFGLLMAAMLSLPMAPLAKPILSLFGVKHPVLLAFLDPILVWIVVVIVFRVASEAVHRKVHTYYKYKVADDVRIRWERLNQNLGLGLGLCCGTIYLLAIGVLVWVVGYATTQVASSDQDPVPLKIVNQLAEGLTQTGMDKAIAPFVPDRPVYYDAADILGLLHHNPLAQSRLASYPVFLSLMDRSEFARLATNTDFQKFWLRRPPIRELISHEVIKPLIENLEYYTSIMEMLEWDLTDLKGYMETGRSAKYDDIKILGRWDFNLARSYKLTRRTKPMMSPYERVLIRRRLESTMENALLTGYLDNRLVLQARNSDKAPQTIQATWQQARGYSYRIKFSGGGFRGEAEASVDGNRLTFVKDGLTLVFDK